MSDISINISWWELIIFSPVLGWPGLLIGGALGALFWRKRPVIGGIIGTIAGNLVWAGIRLWNM